MHAVFTGVWGKEVEINDAWGKEVEINDAWGNVFS